MREFLGLLKILLLICALSVIAKSQNSVSLTSGGFIVVSGQSPDTPISSQSQLGQPISAQLNFGNISPSLNLSRQIIIKVPIRISATTKYKVEFQRLSIGDSSVNPADIGFGVMNIRPQIPNSIELYKNAVSGINAGIFLNNPMSIKIQNGKTKYTTSLENISESPTLVLSGVPTVKSELSEDLGKAETSILIDLVFVVATQYYDPNKPFGLSLNMNISAI